MSFYTASIGIDGRTVRGPEMRNSESVIPNAQDYNNKR